MTINNEEAKRELLLNWQNRAIRASLAHYFQAQEYRTWHSLLTAFNLLSSISVLFLVNNKVFINEPLTPGDIWLSVAGLAVVLSTTLQYVFKLDEKIFNHKVAGNEFTAIKRKIEIMLTNKDINDNDLKRIETDHNHTSKNHHLVRKSIWGKISDREAEALEESSKFLECVGRKDLENQ